ncbi:MAG: WbuC family cupin fold metalloprotein [Verrucomicrobiae bacterium]|nr:WbuC family cupin fold metalloprotein [Verrucomicrobiae bacterium]
MIDPHESSDSLPQALPAFVGDVFTLTEDLLRLGCEASQRSARRRIIYPIHRTQDALVQRMLNFMQPGTWIRPHRHPLPHAIETVQMLRGALGFLFFDEGGNVIATHHLSARSGLGLIDVEPGLWHGMVVLEPDTVLLEIKRGPYDATTDKDFAAWAPEEGDASTNEWLERWKPRFD